MDSVWPEDERPARNEEDLQVHEVEFAGRTWQDKVAELRETLSDSGYDATVITALDETAWLFNLRGRDIPYSPVFRSYAVVSRDRLILYVEPQRQTRRVKDHLNSDGCRGGSRRRDCAEIRDYESVFDDLPSLSDDWDAVLVGKKWAYTQGPSYAVYSTIPKEKLKFDLSPVMLRKSRKNEDEVAGMLRAHVRDSVALIDLAARLEEGMAAGEEWDELKVARELRQRRKAQEHYQTDSFKTISAYGANGAVIHYKPDNVTNARIGTDSLLLLDSGGQYLDGTTDVTRTFHFGQPTAFMREAYTRVLMGAIDLARAVFLKGTPDTRYRSDLTLTILFASSECIVNLRLLMRDV